MKEEVSEAQRKYWESRRELKEQLANGTHKFRLEFRYPNPKYQLPAPSLEKTS